MPGRREPTWLSRIVIDAVHTDQLRAHGGMAGLRDENALESALARPRKKWSYEPGNDLAMPAAAYGFGLVKNHPYRDGNKRISFLAMLIFLELNGYDLDAGEPEILTVMLALADGRLSEDKLAEWIRLRIKHLK
jgi:death-on-curing protein